MVGRLILRENLGARMLEISTKSYRPVARGQRSDGGGSKPVSDLRRRRDHRPPRALPARIAERREDLSTLGVDHSQALPVAPPRMLRDALGERIQRADSDQRDPEPLSEPTRRGDPDPQPRERPGPEPDRDRVDALPPPGLGRCPLDLAE